MTFVTTILQTPVYTYIRIYVYPTQLLIMAHASTAKMEGVCQCPWIHIQYTASRGKAVARGTRGSNVMATYLLQV